MEIRRMGEGVLCIIVILSLIFLFLVVLFGASLFQSYLMNR